MAQLLVLHGPNLDLLGTREPEVYGHATLADIDRSLAAQAQAAGHQLDSFQSNAEHVLVERIQATRNDNTAFILINPAAFTHTSIAIRDALAGVALALLALGVPRWPQAHVQPAAAGAAGAGALCAACCCAPI